MRLTINGAEVEIKVKGKYSSRANKQDTMFFLNTLSIWASEAANHYRYEGAEALEKDARTCGMDIYNALDAAGLYNGI